MNFLLKNDITYFGLIIEENSIAHRLDRLICSITIGFLVDNSGKKPTRVSISIEVDSKHCKVGGLWKISLYSNVIDFRENKQQSCFTCEI